jgi:hypothetical protein
MYRTLSHHAIASSSIEQSVYILQEMLIRNHPPSASFVRQTIQLCCEWAAPRLALQLAERVEQSSSIGARVDISSWAHILVSSAKNQFVSYSPP